METVGTPLLWAGFLITLTILLALDLGVFHRRSHVISIPEAAAWSIFWVLLSVGFGAGVYFGLGATPALHFATAYLLEKALSVDNLFVFLVIFSTFAVPARVQHRVLFWGIFGALMLRGIFIVSGTAVVQRYQWTLYVLGGLLVVTAIKLLFGKEEAIHPERSIVLRLFRKLVPTTDGYRDHAFLVHEGGRWLATPLLLVLVVIETSDLLFAIDSVPAVLAISQDPFIVFTSNALAILGLRSLFFLLAGMLGRFRHLKTGLGLVLLFIGGKLIALEFVHVPVGWSLGVVALLVGGSILVSALSDRPSIATAIANQAEGASLQTRTGSDPPKDAR